jgi:hypothetical protein
MVVEVISPFISSNILAQTSAAGFIEILHSPRYPRKVRKKIVFPASFPGRRGKFGKIPCPTWKTGRAKLGEDPKTSLCHYSKKTAFLQEI